MIQPYKDNTNQGKKQSPLGNKMELILLSIKAQYKATALTGYKRRRNYIHANSHSLLSLRKYTVQYSSQ